MADEILSAETQEVAEPVGVSEGVEEQEVAEPVENGKTEQDAAFADLRRKLEAEQLRTRELEKANAEYETVLGNWFPEDENKAVAAQAYYTGKTQAEILREKEEREATERLSEDNKRLQEELNNLRIEKAMESGLREIQSIDPNVKDLSELGESFAAYIAGGLTSTQAYFACKAEQQATKPVAPKPPGKVNQNVGDKDFYTREEVEAMSEQEVHEHFDDITKSMTKW